MSSLEQQESLRSPYFVPNRHSSSSILIERIKVGREKIKEEEEEGLPVGWNMYRIIPDRFEIRQECPLIAVPITFFTELINIKNK